MSEPRDRKAKLAAQRLVNGIDFVEVVNPEQTRLRVHFVSPKPDKDALAAGVGATAVTITGGVTVPAIPVRAPLTWGVDAEGFPTMELSVAAPGDFSTYTLRLAAAPGLLDPFFDHAAFSFKAGCPSTLDCEVPEPEGPPRAAGAPPIDYLAKDFASFRKALSDFSALRYPAWQERSEPDFGVMFMEALSAVADDLSYLQDRIAAEGWIESAGERRSLVRLARLVDYEPRVATAARVVLELRVAAASLDIPAGLLVSALAPDGTSIDFETGDGLDDTGSYSAAQAWNDLRPHWWDDGQRRLPPGATEMWIEAPAVALQRGQRLLIDTTADPEADPPLREIVELVEVDAPIDDPLYGVKVVRLAWGARDALRFEHDLTRTRAGANLVPATQGRRFVERFIVSRQPWSRPGATPRALVRTGANGTPQFLYALRRPPLAWLEQRDPLERPRPELHVREVSRNATQWDWHRSLLDAATSREIVTVDPVGYRTIDAGNGGADYDGDQGDTIRFGDGVFGAIPADGAVFEVTYRAGGGAHGNVAAGAINRVAAASALAAQIGAVSNPLAAAGGRDREAAEEVREMAPQEFRYRQLRAVRAEDYERAAATLPWVQRAGTAFRYTGSWLTVFTAADPREAETLAPDRAAELTELLDRYRMAGYESYVLDPLFASLDLRVTVCAQSEAFRGDVKEAVLAALDTARRPDGTSGFFHPDRFTFGVPLERSAVEAAVQEAHGVDGVIDVQYRRRGHTPDFVAMPDLVPVAADEIVRVDNDPSRPERGSLWVDVVGGK
ncbi:MAG TPA: hypothetical protein VG389_14510 [Myxococcota bacterium]|jgi:hypothetical protein|nr:hypothetical protein [Myxococcota bacterium]